MRGLLKSSILALIISSHGFAQEPVSVLSSRWFHTVRPAPKLDATPVSPAKRVTPDDKYFQRKAREARTDNPMDPYETSMEGRSAAIDKAVQESRTPRPDDVNGYSYVSEMRNDSGKTIAIIFWEYEFIEIARPTNVTRRQFLCGVKIKNGERKELPVFSLLGPSDVLDVMSLAKTTDKLFHESTFVNRIEFADGSILQRGDWKYADVKASVNQVTSMPWGTEICRAL